MTRDDLRAAVLPDDGMPIDRALLIARGQRITHDFGELARAAARVAYEHEVLHVLVDAARALHVPDGSHDCVACNAHVTTGEPVQWPCPTAAALGTPRVVLSVEWDPA